MSRIKVSSLYMYTPGFPYSLAFKTIILGKWKWKLFSLVQLFATPWTISPWNSLGQNTGVGSLSFSSGSSNPEMEPRSSTLQVDSLPAEPQRKPKNTGVGSLSLLQQIFLTQESNWGLLHCRRIFYQLSYQGNFTTTLGAEDLFKWFCGCFKCFRSFLHYL